MAKTRKTREEFLATLERRIEAGRERVRKKRQEDPEYFRQKTREFLARNPGYTKKYADDFRQKHPGYASLRRALLAGCVPPWFNQEAADDVYRLAKEFKDAGFDVQVDHIFPIKGKYVSGLHVAENLRVCLRKKNLSKGNRFPHGYVDDWYEVSENEIEEQSQQNQ